MIGNGAPDSALRRAADPRFIAGIIIMAGSAIIGLIALDAGPEAAQIAVAARDLPAGTALQPDDLSLQNAVVAEPDRYLGSAEVAGQLAVPVRKGELVPKGAMAATDPGQRLVAVPVEVERLPPSVARGTRVDVWQIGSQGQPVLAGATVVSVAEPEKWAGGASKVVLAVDQDEVGNLLAAARAGAIDISAYGVAP